MCVVAFGNVWLKSAAFVLPFTVTVIAVGFSVLNKTTAANGLIKYGLYFTNGFSNV